MNLLPLTTASVLAWVRLSTSGVPPAAREARRAEILSDVWEHGHAARLMAEAPNATARAIASRCVRGIPADVVWRRRIAGRSLMTAEGWSARGAGVFLITIAAVFVTALTAGRIGIGAEVEHFRDDFPRLAYNLHRAGITIYLTALLGVVSIIAASLLYTALRTYSASLATASAFLLLAAGSLWLVEAAAGRALYDLAAEWRATAGQTGDAVWTVARAVALIYELLAFITAFVMLSSLLAFGVLCLRSAVLPRWLGGRATAAGTTPIIVLALGWLLGGYTYYVFLTGGTLGWS